MLRILASIGQKMVNRAVDFFVPQPGEDIRSPHITEFQIQGFNAAGDFYSCNLAR
jgi:hypothetical protein